MAQFEPDYIDPNHVDFRDLWENMMEYESLSLLPTLMAGQSLSDEMRLSVGDACQEGEWGRTGFDRPDSGARRLYRVSSVGVRAESQPGG